MDSSSPELLLDHFGLLGQFGEVEFEPGSWW